MSSVDFLVPVWTKTALCWSRPLMLVKLLLYVEVSSMVPHLILIALCFLAIDHFTADHACTSISATGHQFWSLLVGL